MTSSSESLKDFVDRTPDLVEYFYNDTTAPHFSRNPRQALIPPAFTNWRDEQYASFETAALLHQSHHMPELFVEGPDAHRLLTSIAVNSLANFGLDQAKQIVAATPAGRMIGDCITYRLGEDKFELISGTPLLNWVEYQAKSGDYDVMITRDDASNTNPTGRRIRYRFELAGPNVGRIFDRIVEGGAPEIPFFRTRTVTIGGHQVLALRHGMVGEIAVELSGLYAEEGAVRSYILQVGEEFGLQPVGTTTYFSQLQGGWIPYPVPAIFTDPALQAYREYLPANTWEASTELGGSFTPANIEDYYVTPFDLGYKHLVKFDHDFFGKEALAQIPDEERREKVTFVWDPEDVMQVHRSQFGSGPRFKAIDYPIAYYAWNQFDEVRSPAGELVGLSLMAAYIGPLGDLISMGIVNHGHAQVGSEVIITWGEPNGGSRKRQVERHEQTTIRARIAPAPYATNSQRNTRRVRLA